MIAMLLLACMPHSADTGMDTGALGASAVFVGTPWTVGTEYTLPGQDPGWCATEQAPDCGQCLLFEESGEVTRLGRGWSESWGTWTEDGDGYLVDGERWDVELVGSVLWTVYPEEGGYFRLHSCDWP